MECNYAARYSGPLRGNFVRDTHSLLTWSCDLGSVNVEESKEDKSSGKNMRLSNVC